MKKLRSFLENLAAIGAVRRKGIGALSSYPGQIRGEGSVTHKSGPKKGKTTKFTIEGQAAARN